MANAGQADVPSKNANTGYDFGELTTKIIMSKLFAILVSALWLTSAHAQATSCTAAAAEKKLAGAAKNSFLKKCEKDATAQCEAAAAERKLAGAAKTSHVKKCVKDAVGPAD
ncbi:hypothetical protein [Limnohabitans sp. 2KL-27]|uniref:hypothetical protein n=1 Tax=Limnohabitans sp. 2KL-27 TaxID=1100705 RepID=UPI0035140531